MLRFAAIILLTILSADLFAEEQVIVLANTDDASLQLRRNEVRNLFMGHRTLQGLEPVGLAPNHPARIVFNTRVVGLTESQVQPYWARMRFTGRSRPPRAFADTDALVAYLLQTPGAVGYLPADHPIPEGLLVVYRSQ